MIHQIVISLFFTFCRWQARREQDRNMRAGLIPSRALQERRIVHERNELNGDIQANQSSDRPDGTFFLLTLLLCFFLVCYRVSKKENTYC